jgi:hypothetical protein
MVAVVVASDAVFHWHALAVYIVYTLADMNCSD